MIENLMDIKLNNLKNLRTDLLIFRELQNFKNYKSHVYFEFLSLLIMSISVSGLLTENISEGWVAASILAIVMSFSCSVAHYIVDGNRITKGFKNILQTLKLKEGLSSRDSFTETQENYKNIIRNFSDEELIEILSSFIEKRLSNFEEGLKKDLKSEMLRRIKENENKKLKLRN